MSRCPALLPSYKVEAKHSKVHLDKLLCIPHPANQRDHEAVQDDNLALRLLLVAIDGAVTLDAFVIFPIPGNKIEPILPVDDAIAESVFLRLTSHLLIR